MNEFSIPHDKPVLVIVEVLEISDPDVMNAYVAAIAPQMAARGARTVAAGLETVVGDTDALNMVAAVWPSPDIYQEWQTSEEYKPWGLKRKSAARIRTHMMPLLPGVELNVA